MGLTWLLCASGPNFGLWRWILGQINNQHPGFALGVGIRALTPDRFSHTSIGLKGPLVGKSPATSPNAARRLCLVYDLAMP
jgi:hypothetical protein